MALREDARDTGLARPLRAADPEHALRQSLSDPAHPRSLRRLPRVVASPVLPGRPGRTGVCPHHARSARSARPSSCLTTPETGGALLGLAARFEPELA